MTRTGERDVKRTNSLFVNDLQLHQESYTILKVANEIIVKVSMHTSACYGVKKCAELIFNNGKMTKGEGLIVLEEQVIALDSENNQAYKFLGCEQGDKIDVKKVTGRTKK